MTESEDFMTELKQNPKFYTGRISSLTELDRTKESSDIIDVTPRKGQSISVQVVEQPQDTKKNFFGFINIASVTLADGRPHDLTASEDIYFHSDQCGCSIPTPGTLIRFQVKPNIQKGSNSLRAVGILEMPDVVFSGPSQIIKPENVSALVKADAATGIILHPSQVPNNSYHLTLQKQFNIEVLDQVNKNNPLPHLKQHQDREYSLQEFEQFLNLFFFRMFQHLMALELDYRVLRADEAELDAKIAATIADYGMFGMTQQRELLTTDYANFKLVKKSPFMGIQYGTFQT